MTISLPIGLSPQAYQGQLYRFPSGLCTPIKQDLGPNTVRVDIDFSRYGITLANPQALIEVNLMQKAVEQPLDKVRSIYIDNSTGYTTVYVIAEDTKHVIACPAHTITWQPIHTNGVFFKVYSAGFFYSLLPTVTLHFSNVPISGFQIPAALATGNGVLVGGLASVVTSGITFTANVPSLAQAPTGPTRVLVAVIAAITTAAQATMSIGNVIFEPATANAAAGLTAINSFTADISGLCIGIGMFYASVPLGGVGSISFQTLFNVNNVGVGLFAVFNSTLVPYGIVRASPAVSTAPNVTVVSPFMTKGGYLPLGMAARGAGAPTPSGIVNATKLAQFNAGNLSFGLAEINGGDDDFVSVVAQPTQLLGGAMWA